MDWTGGLFLSVGVVLFTPVIGFLLGFGGYAGAEFYCWLRSEK